MNPCSKGSLQQGTQIIAFLHMVWAILGVVFGVIILTGGLLENSAVKNIQANTTGEELEGLLENSAIQNIQVNTTDEELEGLLENSAIQNIEVNTTDEELGGVWETSNIQNYQIHTPHEIKGVNAFLGKFPRIIGIVIIVVGILLILLSTLHLRGANKRDRPFCLIWFVVQAIILMLSLVGTFLAVFSEGEKEAGPITGSIIWNLINAYFLWVVWAFMSEIKKELRWQLMEFPKCGFK